MRMRRRVNSTTAFNLIELLLVIAAICIAIVLFLPMLGGSRKSPVVACMVNLKQIGVGFYLWAEDHAGRFPQEVSVDEKGTLEAIRTGSPAPHFQALNKYFRNWSILVCPTDKARRPGRTNTIVLADTNLSYFASVDATKSTTNALLSGDRHLTAAGQPGRPALLILTSNTVLSWTRELHKRSQRPGGNFLFVDGHVAWKQSNLASVIRNQGMTTNRVALP